jgi:hypothetical protein
VILLIMEFEEMTDYEGSLVHLTDISGEDGVESIVECIHKIAMRELSSRSLESMWGWEVRTVHMFSNNHLYHVGDVVGLPLGKVNRLVGCGYQTRKEVYDVFCMYHLKLIHWIPELHYSKNNYKF